MTTDITIPHAAVPALTITLRVEVKTLRDLLVTAAEGGSNYWADLTHPRQHGEPHSGNYDTIHVREHEAHADDTPAFSGDVTALMLLTGLQRLADCVYGEATVLDSAAEHLMHAINEQGDAVTADVVLQMALFGEIVYG